jgi:hypothetical protein
MDVGHFRESFLTQLTPEAVASDLAPNHFEVWIPRHG